MLNSECSVVPSFRFLETDFKGESTKNCLVNRNNIKANMELCFFIGFVQVNINLTYSYSLHYTNNVYFIVDF